MNIPLEIITFVAAEITFILAKSADILVIAKTQSQRTPFEQHRIKRGLKRSIIIDGILFVPSSAILALLLAPLLVPTIFKGDSVPTPAINALIGVVSYGFPFAAVRQVVTLIALNTLRAFANTLPRKATLDHNRSSGK